MKSLSLPIGKTMLTTIRPVKGGSYQLEIAETVENPEAQVNILGQLNADDERFAANTPKSRRGWINATAAQIKNFFGISVEDLKFDGERGEAEVMLENPTLGAHKLVLQLEDSFTPNYNNNPKQFTNRKTDVTYVFFSQGKPVYQNTRVVAEKDRKHLIIKAEEQKTLAEFEAYSATVKTAEKETVTTESEDLAVKN